MSNAVTLDHATSMLDLGEDKVIIYSLPALNPYLEQQALCGWSPTSQDSESEQAIHVRRGTHSLLLAQEGQVDRPEDPRGHPDERKLKLTPG